MFTRMRLRIAQWIVGMHAAVIPTKLFVTILHDAAGYRMEHPDQDDGVQAAVYVKKEQEEGKCAET